MNYQVFIPTFFRSLLRSVFPVVSCWWAFILVTPSIFQERWSLVLPWQGCCSTVMSRMAQPRLPRGSPRGA